MGCDIHIVIQAQETDGSWREIPYQYTPWKFLKEAPLPDLPMAPESFTARNYDLFGILANVRNGTGFAGCTTGEGWPSIATGRGLPAGFDTETAAPNPRYPEEGPRWMGDHSYTWVTLDELKAFNWDGLSTTLYGVVDADLYEKMKPNEKPNEWSGGIYGPNIETYDRPGYLKAKRTGRLAPKPYVRVSWTETARSATRNWPGKIIPWLEGLAAGRALRLVLGFDS